MLGMDYSYIITIFSYYLKLSSLKLMLLQKCKSTVE